MSRLDVEDRSRDSVGDGSRDSRGSSNRSGSGNRGAAASTRVAGELVVTLLSEIVWKVCTAGKNGIYRRWDVSRPAKGDGGSTRSDDLGDGCNERGWGGSASEVGGTISKMLGVDIHTLPFPLDGSVTVVFVADTRLSCSDSRRG